MGGLNFWGMLTSSQPDTELPELYPFPFEQAKFVECDIKTLYAKILTDVLERTLGISEENRKVLFDNCLASEAKDGLVSMLTKAMFGKKELFIVFDQAVKVLREATSEERSIIETDYKTKSESATGIFVSFKNFELTEMLKVYSTMEFHTVAGLNKSMGLTRAVQIKINDLRGSVSLTNSADAKAQALAMATGLSKGKDIVTDAKDIIETAKVDIDPIEKSICFINQKRSYYLNLPASYITGEQSASGLSDTGKADTKAIDRGLKIYFFSIIKPVVDALFGMEAKFEAQDLSQIKEGLEAAKTFQLTDESIVNLENKTKIVNRLLDLPADAKGDMPKTPPFDPNAKPVPGAPGQKPPAPGEKPAQPPPGEKK